MRVREGQRWKRDNEDGDTIRIKAVQFVEGAVRVVASSEPPVGYEPEFWATPQYIEARYTLIEDR